MISVCTNTYSTVFLKTRRSVTLSLHLHVFSLFLFYFHFRTRGSSCLTAQTTSVLNVHFFSSARRMNGAQLQFHPGSRSGTRRSTASAFTPSSVFPRRSSKVQQVEDNPPPTPTPEPAPLFPGGSFNPITAPCVALKGLPRHSRHLLRELCGLDHHQGRRAEANLPPSRVLLHVLDIAKSRRRCGEPHSRCSVSLK